MASRGVNKVILLGKLGKDPEMRYLPNGGAVATLSLATSETWRDKQTGEQKERTEWHRVEVFGKLAEVVGEYLRKGSQVYFEGKLKTDEWQDSAGQKRYSTKVVADEMQMIGSKKDAGQQSGQQNGGWGQPQQPPAQSGQQPRQPRSNDGTNQGRTINDPPAGNNEPPMDFDDDIPF